MWNKFRDRSYEKELLDEENIPFTEIKKTLKELHFINSTLGGYNATKFALKSLLSTNISTVRIADIGSGGGDTLMYISRWCEKNGIQAELTGIDIKKECVDYARTNTSDYSNIRFIQSNYKDVDLEFDIIHSCLFTHHLNDLEIDQYLKWGRARAKMAVVSNDLHRHFLAYYSIKWLTNWFSRSYLVKNDACLSVWRSFRSAEWENIGLRNGFSEVECKWMWAFRYSTILKV